MRRRQFISLLGGAAVSPSLATQANPGAGSLRVGAASLTPRSYPFWVAFEERMAALGYQEGRNLTFDFVQLASSGAFEAGYRELVARDADILLATGSAFRTRCGPVPMT